MRVRIVNLLLKGHVLLHEVSTDGRILCILMLAGRVGCQSLNTLKGTILIRVTRCSRLAEFNLI